MTTNQNDSEIMELTDRLVGLFSTLKQVKIDLVNGAEYMHAPVSIRSTRVDIKGLEGQFLYLEQTLCMPDSEPYRVRVYQFQRLDDGTIINRIYRLNNEKEVMGAFADPNRLALIDASQLSEETGCHVTWLHEGNAFRGSAGKDGKCISRQYHFRLVADAELYADRLIQKDVGYNEKGELQMGPPDGVVGHIFERHSNNPFLN